MRNRRSTPKSEHGMTLFAVLAAMAIFAVILLAVAPTIQIEVQRERELEQIRRGEEVAEAIRLFVEHHRGTKLPNSMDDLLDGLPIPGSPRKRHILRASSAIDPLSEDGKWRLIKPELKTIGPFAKRIQTFNNGLLPNNPEPRSIFDQYSIRFLVNLDTGGEENTAPADDDDFEVVTEYVPFIGVASQSRAKSVIAYYGIENHSKWIFTPLFRGAGANQITPSSSGSNTNSIKP